MIWKNLTDKLQIILIVYIVGLGLPSLTLGQESPFSKLKQTFENGSIFKAEFHHQTVDSYTRDTVASSGHIWVGNQEYRVQADNKSVVVDGKTSTVYDEDRNRVIISKYEPEDDDFAPSRILNGVDSTFTVQNQEIRENEIYILLSSDDPFAIYKKVELFLTKSLIPKKIVAVDPADNIITTTFSEGKFMKPEEGMFTLSYPESAEKVDMRN
ncbi:LolA family protein [Fodinibius sp. SL11]|uniref:LolA family protein n=1 Tax=Fodinibius sp. SL11 TaxID=3425690 RepID=UPI003F88573B